MHLGDVHCGAGRGEIHQASGQSQDVLSFPRTVGPSPSSPWWATNASMPSLVDSVCSPWWKLTLLPVSFYWLGWLTSVLTFVNFSLVHSTGLSHFWAGWQFLPSLCSPSSCISFHWDTLSLSGVSKAILNCLYHFKNLVFNGWLTLTVLFGIYGHEAALWWN